MITFVTVYTDIYKNPINTIEWRFSKFKDIASTGINICLYVDKYSYEYTIEFVKDLKCGVICISVPHCHYKDDSWFEEWKHRRPNEHLWHFDKNSLSNFMTRMEFVLVSSSNIEDTIRKNKKEESNILTCIFRKV